MKQIEIEVSKLMGDGQAVDNLTVVIILCIVGFLMVIAACIGFYNCYMIKLKSKMVHDANC